MTITTPASQSIEIKPQDSSYRYSSLMGEDYAEIIIKVPEYTEVPVGSTISIEGKTYTLMQPQHVTKHSDRNYEITLRFEGTRAALRKYMFRDLYGSLKFSNTVKLSEHMDLITYNLNQREGGWSYSINEEDAERTITVSHNTIADTLEQIREAYKTEWDINSKHIAIGKIEHFKDNPLPLSYGKGNGFKSGVKRENNTSEQQIDVLFVQGGERNIDPSTYGSRFLKMPPEITFPYEGSNYQTGALGHSIFLQGKNTPGAVEGSLDLSEIYPKREGTVTTVTSVNPSKNFFDFTDSGIPSDLDFNNYLIAGEKPLIVFQSGELAGKEFEFSQYVHATRTFKVVPQQIDGETMPALIESGAFRIQPGDRYIVTNISMPAAYLRNDADKTGASWEMALQAAKFLSERSKPRFSFIGDLDNIWAAQIIEHQGSDIPRWDVIKPKIKVGSHVLFSDPSIESQGVVIRITGVKSLINKPSNTEIELSNVSGSTSLSSVLKKQENEKVNTKETNYRSIQFAKRGFSQAQETATALQNALLGIEGDIENLEGSLAAFSGSINPITVSTMQVLLGDPSLQFYFVNNTTTPQRVPHTVTYNNSTKQLTSPAGIIQHKTIGITDIKPARAASEYRYWSFNSATINMSGYDASRYYYLYAKCNKANSSGAFIIEQDPKAMEDSTHYYLLMGILNSEHEAERSYVSLYGFTEILPGRITIDKLISESGYQFIDLQTGEIRGNFTFTNGENVGSKLDTAIQNALAALQAAQDAQDFIDNTLPGITDDITEQLDRKIESWFQASDPAIAWTTNEVRSAHTGDMWYNTTTKLLKRYTLNGSVYSWSLIEDQKAIDAYTTASLAKDTADGKRRVFVSQPQTADAYDIGDLWVNATTGQYADDLLRCVVAKTADQNFSINHWALASKYTDDTAAIVAQNLAKFGAGKMLYRDPTFAEGMNSTSLYNNSGGTAVSLERIARQSDNPSTSTHQLKITYVGGSNGADPGLGGFRFENATSRAGGIYIIRLVAKVPVGYTLEAAYNSIGTGGDHTWLSSRAGTGAYQDYIVMIKCGSSGTFSTHGYIYLEGPATPNIEWHIAYGTILDAIEPEMKSTQYLLQALKGSTDVNGGLLATVVMMLKNALGEVTGGMSGLSNDNIGMWAGGSYEDALAGIAKFIVTKDGSAKLAGTIEAQAGKIGGLDIYENSLKSETMAFSESPVETLAQLVTPTSVGISYISSWSDTGYNETATAESQEITITVDSQLRFRASCEPELSADYSDRRWTVNVLLTNGTSVFQQSGNGTLTNQLFIVNLPAGTYKIRARAMAVIPIGESYTNYASITGELGSTIYAAGYNYQTKIGSDGFYSFWNTDKYIYFKSNYGFEGRWGNIGLRFITGQSNPQKMIGGVWSNL